MSVAVQGIEAQPTPTKPAAVIVQQGKILDYIDGLTQRSETPEEYVRQEIAKSLVREYGYEKAEISVEFILRLGSESLGPISSSLMKVTAITKTAPE